MTKNQWDVDVVTDAEDFIGWEWGEAYGEAYGAFVREVSIEAAKIVNAELVKDVMFDLRTTENDAMIHAMLFEGNLEFCYSLNALVTECIESFESGDAPRKIRGPDERPQAEQLLGHLERAAAAIRAALS